MIMVGNALVHFDERKIIFESAIFNLEPKTAKLLELLVLHQGSVVTRQLILDAVYPAQYISDNAINRLIADLRKIFRADPESIQYIETIPKSGYKLVAKTELDIQKNSHIKISHCENQERRGQKATTQNHPSCNLGRRRSIFALFKQKRVVVQLSLFLFVSALISIYLLTRKSNQFIDLSKCEGLAPWFIAGTNARDYNVCSLVDSSNTRLYFLQNRIDSPEGFVTLMRQEDAEKYRGQQVVFSASVKTQNVNEGVVGIFLRGQKDYKGGTNAFVNSEMINQSIVDDSTWKVMELKLNIPIETNYIAFGIYLKNNANVSVNRFEIKTILGPADIL